MEIELQIVFEKNIEIVFFKLDAKKRVLGV
jgi:hypothetical protein